jgi:hypothetical protein
VKLAIQFPLADQATRLTLRRQRDPTLGAAADAGSFGSEGRANPLRRIGCSSIASKIAALGRTCLVSEFVYVPPLQRSESSIRSRRNRNGRKVGGALPRGGHHGPGRIVVT